MTDTVFAGETRICVVQGDITTQHVDAIVNAANSSLLGGGGVDGAIHRAGGNSISDACRRIRKSQYPAGLPTGKAVVTSGGELPARYVIHTVGPVWKGGYEDEDQLLSDAYINSLEAAYHYSLSTVAFPAISTGVYHFPISRAAHISLMAIGSFLKQHPGHFQEILLVLFSEPDFDTFQTVLKNLPKKHPDNFSVTPA